MVLEKLLKRKGDESLLRCQVCAKPLNLVSVSLTRKKEITKISSKGIEKLKAENSAKGVLIELQYACENGHIAILSLPFYKLLPIESIDLSPQIAESTEASETQ